MYAMKNVILNSKVLKAFVLAGGLMMSTFSAHADLVLSFGESDVEVNLNDTFTLELFVNVTAGVDWILAWGLDLDLSNSSLLDLNSFTLGSDFVPVFGSDDGIGGAAAFGPLFGSNILLGTFEFTALGYGSTSASTSNTLGDIFEGFTTTSFFTPTVFNSPSANISVVSAPATVGLFGIAVLGLAGLRRKA
jgi:hypothetical protein